jgi:hypothetical protein
VQDLRRAPREPLDPREAAAEPILAA